MNYVSGLGECKDPHDCSQLPLVLKVEMEVGDAEYLRDGMGSRIEHC